MSSTSRIPSLDGWRAVAVLMVIFHHFTNSVSLSDPVHQFLIVKVLGNGYLGVKIFFGISGFLITRLLVLEKRKTGKISLPYFYIRRFLRIIPPYYLMIAGSLWFFGDKLWRATEPSLPWLLTLTTNYMQNTPVVVFAHSWSISVEEHFYLIWPVTLIALGLLSSRKFLVGLIVSAFIIRWLCLPETEYEHAVWWWTKFATHMQLDSLAWGALFALLWDESWFQAKLKRALERGLHWYGILICFVVTPLLEFNDVFQHWDIIRPSLETPSIALMIAGSVVNYRAKPWQWLQASWLVWIGSISYGLYLWQEPLMTWCGLGELTLGRALITTAWIFGLAAASYYLLEKPLYRVRQRFSKN